MMKKLSLLSGLMFGVYLGLSSPVLAAESAEAIVKKADDARFPNRGVSFLVTVKDFRSGKMEKESRLRVAASRFDSVYYSLVETLFPEREKGRKLLMQGTNLWIYLPSVKRWTRISFREKLTGEVANGDIATTNYANDYSAKLLGNEKLGDHKAFKLELTGKNKDVTYQKIIYWVEEGTYYPLKADFYALSGKLLKTGEYLDFKPMLGRPRATKMVIKDALNPGKQSQLLYSEVKYESVDKSSFNKDSIGE